MPSTAPVVETVASTLESAVPDAEATAPAVETATPVAEPVTDVATPTLEPVAQAPAPVVQTAADAVAPPVDRVRIFAGYSGWGPGQLEDELAADGWFVVEVDNADLWSEAPSNMWRTVLRRQRGQLRVFADFPLEPESN